MSKWNEILGKALHEAEKYYNEQKNPLTLRGLFYILVSKNIIPNTVSTYKRLSKLLAEKRYTGEFPPHLIADMTRRRSYLEEYEAYPKELSEEELKKIIEEIIQKYASFTVNAWLDQPKRVIIAIEKEALYNITLKWITELNIEGRYIGVYALRCLKGFDSATDIINLAEEVRQLKRDGYRPVILVISDFDASGEEIYMDFNRRLTALAGNNVTIEKVMVTKEQIYRYNLPYTPESQEEIAKIKRDSRFRKFYRKHGLMRVEVDALYSIRPEDAKQILHTAILNHFNISIYTEETLPRIMSLQRESETIKEKMRSKLARLLSP